MWTNSHVPHLYSTNDQNPKIRVFSVRVYAFALDGKWNGGKSEYHTPSHGWFRRSAFRSFLFPTPAI